MFAGSALAAVSSLPGRFSRFQDAASASGCRLGNFCLNGVLNQLAARAQRELLLDMSLVGFYCLHAEVQFFGDLPRTPAFADQTEHLELTIGESREMGIHAGRSSTDVLVQKFVGHSIAEIDVSTKNAPVCHQHLFGGLLLHDVAVGTSPP